MKIKKIIINSNSFAILNIRVGSHNSHANVQLLKTYMSKTITLTDKNFEDEVIKNNLPVLVDFWAPWCGPCKMMVPILDDLAEEFAGKIKIAKLDVEELNHAELAGKYNIQSIPNMKLFMNGNVIQEYIGYRDKEIFKQELLKEIK